MDSGFEAFRNDLLADPAVAEEYRRLQPQYQVAEQVIRLRQERGLTQTKLAELAGTKQSGISRLEHALSSPSLSFLVRVADALDATLDVRLVPTAREADLT